MYVLISSSLLNGDFLFYLIYNSSSKLFVALTHVFISGWIIHVTFGYICNV